jgi:hypothetical protein
MTCRHYSFRLNPFFYMPLKGQFQQWKFSLYVVERIGGISTSACNYIVVLPRPQHPTQAPK